MGSERIGVVGAAEGEGPETVGALARVGVKVGRESACSWGEGPGTRAHRLHWAGGKHREGTWGRQDGTYWEVPEVGALTGRHLEALLDQVRAARGKVDRAQCQGQAGSSETLCLTVTWPHCCYHPSFICGRTLCRRVVWYVSHHLSSQCTPELAQQPRAVSPAGSPGPMVAAAPLPRQGTKGAPHLILMDPGSWKWVHDQLGHG